MPEAQLVFEYFAHAALIGALVGGLLGVLTFQLVSKRCLNLVPVSN